MMVLLTLLCKYLFKSQLLIILDTYLEVEHRYVPLGHMVVLRLTFWGSTNLLSTEAAPFLFFIFFI